MLNLKKITALCLTLIMLLGGLPTIGIVPQNVLSQGEDIIEELRALNGGNVPFYFVGVVNL